jgi:protein-L-isoaspartate O-methyltransferase
MPSYHAPLIFSAAVRNGDHVVHVGAGLGYYSAFLAHLAGSMGRVTASGSPVTLKHNNVRSGREILLCTLS